MKYYILENGGLPFVVDITKDHLRLFRRIFNFETDTYTNEKNPFLDFSLRGKRVFLPEKINLQGYAPATGKDRGNSILVELKPHQYLYIGPKIYVFTTRDTIQHYYSPVGNSAVPYPFAVGDKYTYLMLEDIKIPNADIPIQDPYRYYYFEMPRTLKTKYKKFTKKIITDSNWNSSRRSIRSRKSPTKSPRRARSPSPNQ